MMTKKKIVTTTAVLTAMLAVGIAVAAVTLSNTLTAHWTVINGESLRLSYTLGPDYNGSNIAWGTWSEFELQVYNPTSATFNGVYVTLTLSQDSQKEIPDGAFQIQYSADSVNWFLLTVSTWSGYGSAAITGTLWSVGAVGPSATNTTYFKIMYNNTMPLGGVSATLVCQQ